MISFHVKHAPIPFSLSYADNKQKKVEFDKKTACCGGETMICHEIETEILAKFTNVHRIQFTTTFSVLFFHIEVGFFAAKWVLFVSK